MRKPLIGMSLAANWNDSGADIGSGNHSSFRDPDGKLHRTGARIFRTVSANAAPLAREFLASTVAKQLSESGKLIGTWEAPSQDVNRILPGEETSEETGPPSWILEHDRVWFPSYPYEWPAEMLVAAGDLTLDIAQSALKERFGLKDATPYNVLFRGPKPVFVDILSFEKRDAADPRWLPYAQFVRTFVLPLLMNKNFGMRTDEIFISATDGLQPEDVYRHCNWAKRIKPPILTTVSIPTWLAKRVAPDEKKLYVKTGSSSPEKARFILEMRLRAARKLLRRVKPVKERDSVWSSYLNNLSYSEADFREKSEFVKKWASDIKPQSVLDVGCNTGHFSEIAARSGARVVGIDLDPVTVGLTWRRAVAESLDILPLTINLARPTPATGWRNAEYPSFLQRATGSFDMILMLAVLHHLLVTDRIPLAEIIDLSAELTTGHLVMEYVSKDDPLFQRLTRGRESLHANFSQQSFETAFQRRFDIIEKHPVKGNLRWLYLFRKKNV